MNELEYIKKLNTNTISMYIIIMVVASVSYVIDFPKHKMVGAIGISLMVSALLLSVGICIIEYCRSSASKNIRYVITAGYICCCFSMTCLSDNPSNFTYIFPLFSTLLVFCDVGLIGVLCLISLVFNVLAGYFHMVGLTATDSSTFGHIFTQFAVMILSAGFSIRSVKLLSIKNELFSDALDSKYQDSLTGLKNVRFIDESRENRFLLRKNPKFNIAFIDIDDFKRFNTKFGHSVGDMVLKDIALILMKNTAGIPHTYAIRNGGDEFLIISRSLQSDAFIALVDKCRYEIETARYQFLPDNISVTVSVGVATKDLDHKCKSFQELYDLADSRNRDAKSSGKNKVIIEE